MEKSAKPDIGNVIFRVPKLERRELNYLLKRSGFTVQALGTVTTSLILDYHEAPEKMSSARKSAARTLIAGMLEIQEGGSKR